jgi:ATP-binding protein involved in chromosome partitioning
MITEQQIKDALRGVKYPGFNRDIVSFGLLKTVVVEQGAVDVILELSSTNLEASRQIKADCEKVLQALPDVESVRVEVRQPSAKAGGSVPDPWATQSRVPGIRRIVAVASGKGGVGKSTVAVNLACALQHLGAKTGLLDSDIYGPSIPLMMGTRERPSMATPERMRPPEAHGVKLMSIGFLLDDSQPVIWRAPMVVQAIKQFISLVDWGELDFLVVDLPPGTGDAQLSLCQTVPLDGGVIVTTPQEASLGVVRKGLSMFRTVNVPILGIVENMSYFLAPSGERLEIFGHGGGRAEAERQQVPFLGEIPLFTEIRAGGDTGKPVVAVAPDSAPAQPFLAMAKSLRQTLG